MRICFFTSEEVSPIIGGIQRITYSVAESLKELYGWKCYSVFVYRQDMESVCPVFEDTQMIGKPWVDAEPLREALKRWRIDIFVNQSCFWLSPVFKKAAADAGAKYVFCHHFEPGSEIRLRFSFLKQWKEWKKKPSLKGFLKNMLYPYYTYLATHNDNRNYAKVYRDADRVVLLSGRFIPQYMQYAEIHDKEKFSVIHNSLSFDYFMDASLLPDKAKEVLVVSRLEETQKKISIALRVWQEIEKDERLQDWKLCIVGRGSDEEKYTTFAAKNHLRRMSFEGRQSPEPYYVRSSIFLMTSSTEGWGLTLTEAQQYGCVPLAFDTYASVHDIIQDGKNGYVVPAYDIARYVERVKELMLNAEKRVRMATNAVESSRRFEKRAIAAQWHELFEAVHAE